MTHEHTQRMALAAAVGWALFGAVGCDGDTDDDDTAVADDDDAAVDDDNGDDDTATDDDDSVPTQTAFHGSCTVDVAYTADAQDPPASGTFWFGIDLVEGGGDEPADRCWVELWDDASTYCEGYDTDTGDPCNDQDIERPGWYMSLDAEGTTPQPWQIWSLELPYVHTWPPQEDASYFVCEMAGNNFGTYLCCCDQEAPADCYCAEFMDW